MKKFLGMLLTFTLVISSISVVAYYDIDDSNVESAVDILSSFDIINGYEDGSFRPDAYITRAEFSKIIVKTCTYEYNGYDENTGFYDVSSSDWAKDYIYIAKNLNIVNGVDNRHFEPESNITYEQAIKMIVAALGYGDKAEKVGYPQGYINIANSLGITDNVNYINEDYATRGDIAVMVNNALYSEYYNIWNENGTIKRQLSDISLYEKHMMISEILENGGVSMGVDGEY